MTSLCWLASVSPFPGSSFSHSALIETECITQQAPHDYFNKSSKCCLVGIVKKLIRLICRDFSSGGEEGPRAICGSVVCLVGCDEWVERMLICAWKASQLLSCWESITAADTGRHPPPEWGCGDAVFVMSGPGALSSRHRTAGDQLTPV